MMPAYLCSVRRSRGRAEQIGQDSQTSLLWLWSRSNSLPFPEALSAMTQGFHYHYNQRPLFHQPATQKVLLTGDAVCVCLSCVWTHACPCVYILSKWVSNKASKKDQKRRSGVLWVKGILSCDDKSHEYDHTKWFVYQVWLNQTHQSLTSPGMNEISEFSGCRGKNSSVYTVLLPRFAWKPLKSNQAPTHGEITSGHGDDFYSSFIPP